METVLIRNGTIVTAAERYAADVYLEGGVVSSIGRQLGWPADTVLDASGLLVLPGGIDAHTHLDMPLGDIASTDDFETGTIAAACGGTTTIIDFATQEAGQGLLPALDAWMARAEGKAVIDYAFHMALCEWNDRTASDMARLAQRDGVTSFKLFMAYPGRLMLDDAAIFQALRNARNIGALVSIHAENGGVIDVLVREALRRGDVAPRFHALTRPAAAEREAVSRAIALAEMAGAPVYIVHVSCAGAVECIEQARERGLLVHGETCPHYLILSDAEYERAGFEAAKYVMSPPLRSGEDQDALWRAAASRVIEVVATDHCPFGMDNPPHKQRGRGDFSKIPNGAPGIETRLMLMWDGGVRAGRISPNRFVDLTSTAPARIFGLWPRKGTVAVGADADLVLWDPGAQTRLSASTHHMRVDYSLYEGRAVTGAPAVVLSRGEVIVRNGAYVGGRGRGRFLRRDPYSGLSGRIDS
jgi:dihydropyrimidinase